MAILSGFFNSVNGDRKYDTNDITSLFTGIFADGVFKTVGNNFMVKASSGMEVTIDTGKAWFDKRFIENTALLPKSIDQSEVLLDRIDAYVIEIDDTEPVRAATIAYVKGTPASEPQKPELVKTEKKTQYPIAYITVSHGATSITDANIEIMVGKSECPFAVGVIEGVNIDNLFVQWEAEFGGWMTLEQSNFTSWFNNIKGQLSEDAAGHLQVQIDETNERITAMHEVVQELITIQPSEWNQSNDVNIENSKIVSGINVYIEIPYWQDASTDIILAIQNANIVMTVRNNGTHRIGLKALNGKPAIAIKLRVIYSGNISGIAAQTLSENSVETYYAPENQNGIVEVHEL